MGYVKTYTHSGVVMKGANEVGINKKIVISLPSKVPWEWWHRLRNDFNFIVCRYLFEALDQSLAEGVLVLIIEMMVLREATNIGDQKDGLIALEALTEIF